MMIIPAFGAGAADRTSETAPFVGSFIPWVVLGRDRERVKQFAMVKPGANRVDLGLILKDVPTISRLESAAGFNAAVTHQVRIRVVKDMSPLLRSSPLAPHLRVPRLTSR